MSNYITSLTPLRSAIIGSGISTSIFFLANMGAVRFGVVPALQDPKISLAALQKAKLWSFFYDGAAPVFAGSAVTAFLTLGVTAYLHPEVHGKWIAGLGSLACLVIPVFTIKSMMPVNKQLQAICAGDAVREPYTEKLIEKWQGLHVVRLFLGGFVYLCALALRETI